MQRVAQAPITPMPSSADMGTTAEAIPARALASSPPSGRDVDLVDDDGDRHVALREFGGEAVFEGAPGAGFRDDDPQVDPVENGARALHPQFAEGTLVVDAGGVDEEDRSERQEFHRLLHRVGGGAGEFRDDGDLLPRDGVEQRRLADVAAAEDADVRGGATSARTASSAVPERA